MNQRAQELQLALLAAMASCSGRGSELSDTGPLSCPDCATEGVSMPIDVGHPFTHGLITLKNRGSQDVRLIRATVLKAQGPLRILGITALIPDGLGLVAIAPGYPPRGY